MKQTEHLNLNQWDPSDRILREDFNRDNARLDAALAGRLGRMEDILLWESEGSQFDQGGGFTGRLPSLDWSEWEYVCALVQFPNATTADEQIVGLSLNCYGDKFHKIPSLPMPGFLIVFLPRHNADARLAGFILSGGFIPFSFESPFRNLGMVFITTTKGSVTLPNIAWFGGR